MIIYRQAKQEKNAKDKQGKSTDSTVVAPQIFAFFFQLAMQPLADCVVLPSTTAGRKLIARNVMISERLSTRLSKLLSNKVCSNAPFAHPISSVRARYVLFEHGRHEEQ